MKVGIIGLPQSGRRTLYTLLTGNVVGPAEQQGKDPVVGVAPVLDPVFDSLVAMYRPRKETRASMTIELLPPLEENAIREGAIFRDIAGTDALCLVVRAFEDGRVYHVMGSVDPLRDIDVIFSELVMHDLIFIEKRLERIAEGRKKNRDDRGEKEEPILLRMRDHLERELPLRTMEFGMEDRKLLSGYPFLTMKEMIVALNASESSMSDDVCADGLRVKYQGHGISVVQISALLEAEISSLESAAEREDFMREAGISEPALSLLTRALFASLGLISFFTVGEDEVRQWMVRCGASAPEAAGVIHSDIQRGFIRAEVIKYDDLISLGSEESVKKAGKQHVMGKDYPVEDRDIISFRFNV
ncbi:MAG: redox-regulated ATPase YchF [Spirochaetes bacterium]|nr:redox-regulated ATPase YchF [Spirochaetota bacterium]